MYHVYCIVLALLICWIFFKGETFPFQHLIVDTLSLSFTIIVSKLSYDWIETPIRALGRKNGRPPQEFAIKICPSRRPYPALICPEK
jgi:peptidoglycan/LPS O-acetylase OafA/YrhL